MDEVAGNQGYLPAELSSFIGRERELSELRQLVQQTRTLTLCGPAGVGKTRLALRLLASVGDAFPSGVWFVELADLRQPELVVSRVAEVLGVDEEPGRPLAETLVSALRPRLLLLALDNCEHLVRACAVLSRLLLTGAPHVTLLVTSREPLRVAGETTWEVPPLPVVPPGAGPPGGDPCAQAAVQLFAARAAERYSGFVATPGNVAAIASVCQALDGLPLAIELAAARARVLSVEQIRARLSDRFALLADGDPSVLPRHRTLGAAIGWSYDLLTGPERVLFRRLSVFAGWSLEMAEAVCSGGEVTAGDTLILMAALADKSLVVCEPESRGQARYRMLDSIREYAAVHLAEAGESAEFQSRLRDYVLRVAEESLAVGMAGGFVPWPDRVDCSRRYDAESGTVAQVLAWCLAQGDAETGLRVCVAVSPRWIVWGTFAEGGEWLDGFLALHAAVAGPVRGAALIARAQLALASAPAAAGHWARDGLRLCREGGAMRWTAAALNVLSEIALRAGQPGEAMAFADEALALALAAGDGWNEGYALGTRSAVAARLGQLVEARQLAEASVTVMRRIDQRWGVARALLGLGDLARAQHRPGEAHSRYVEALPILQQIGARPQIARCLAGLGRVAMGLGAAEQARRHLTRSIQVSQATGARLGVARGLEAFAVLAARENLPERAVQLTAAAAALRQAAGLAPLPAGRTEACLAPARGLGEPAVAGLWAQGQAMDSQAAVALAVTAPQQPAPAADGLPALAIVRAAEAEGQRPRPSPPGRTGAPP
jgi:predicted ATPase